MNRNVQEIELAIPINREDCYISSIGITHNGGSISVKGENRITPLGATEHRNLFVKFV